LLLERKLPTKIISTKSAEHYKWGGPQRTNCDGWHLVKTPELSVIEELMPPNTNELRHSHAHARQFFFVLEGELTLEVDHHNFVLRRGEGLEISPTKTIKPSTEAHLQPASSSPANHRATATE
jgi:mannose-6-phosphate isomerase-like protein (cupin superfamily)